MPSAPVPLEIDRFLQAPNPAVVASLRPDGSPHSAATWYDWEDGRVLLNMEDTRLRLRFLERDGRVALTVLDKDNWYRHVSLLGVVDELRPDEDRSDIDRLSRRYIGQPYGSPGARVTAWVRIDRWHSWDGGGPMKF